MSIIGFALSPWYSRAADVVNIGHYFSNGLEDSAFLLLIEYRPRRIVWHNRDWSWNSRHHNEIYEDSYLNTYCRGDCCARILLAWEELFYQALPSTGQYVHPLIELGLLLFISQNDILKLYRATLHRQFHTIIFWRSYCN